MKITIFSEELRKCLNSAGLSDCGENDTWNYWYQRLMNAYNESVERQIMTEQTENAKLRELAAEAWRYINHPADATWTHEKRKEVRDSLNDRMRELGVDE